MIGTVEAQQTNGRTSGIWWIELLRREGVLTALVFVYAFWIAIPESQDRRAALDAQVRMVAHVSTLADQIMAAEKAQGEWADGWEKKMTAQHRARQEEHQAILKKTDEILRLAKLRPAPQ